MHVLNNIDLRNIAGGLYAPGYYPRPSGYQPASSGGYWWSGLSNA